MLTPDQIREATPAELYDDMALRFGRDLLTSIYNAGNPRTLIGCTLTHLPTGKEVVERGHPNAFKARRAAYARLVELIMPDETNYVRPETDDEARIVADLVFGPRPDLVTVADVRAEANLLIQLHRRKTA
ncbi:hypothetical protein SEA_PHRAPPUCCINO_148 [Mycobacterium phage Phrappuccino]|uniref:Uncharacterized protein n=1 Tax=Mycobacterium phage Phrappuccino TaxID=2591223 RepID=A0A514DDX9_9CAUD|nr:hypothetical protein KHQ87_gp148 [Mycobacterium phage Phrappuccino]QDH91823.1 hypothetical protein SEA_PHRAPPUCCINO_148 [Mycobacterium phage Phrappuccino]QIQ63265.1 hypothetical protein SEA_SETTECANDELA_148 [Mycobacterium phage Settecandela]